MIPLLKCKVIKSRPVRFNENSYVCTIFFPLRLFAVTLINFHNESVKTFYPYLRGFSKLPLAVSYCDIYVLCNCRTNHDAACETDFECKKNFYTVSRGFQEIIFMHGLEA